MMKEPSGRKSSETVLLKKFLFVSHSIFQHIIPEYLFLTASRACAELDCLPQGVDQVQPAPAHVPKQEQGVNWPAHGFKRGNT
jgi:hypothetical protein